MKIHLLVVGRTVSPPLAALIDDYATRLHHYVPFTIETIPALKGTKPLDAARQCQREGEQLLSRLRPDDHVVLLDEGGRQYRSVAFASWLGDKFQRVPRRLVFLVGGPYGFSPAVRSVARESLSLSSMTFSHQLIRLLFVEQLYRAMTILKGEPYHHE